MSANTVEGFLPSTHGFRFANRWPPGPALRWRLPLLEIGVGDTSRGLCGGMIFATRDRYERGAGAADVAAAPEPWSPLFDEIVARQLASFGRLWTVPLRFWLASALYDDRRRLRETVRTAWPRIRAEIDGGHPSMVGLVRRAGWNPLDAALGHQVLAYRYDASPGRVAIGVYDPNHPGDDTVEIHLEWHGSEIRLSQSTGEPLLALLDLPYSGPAERPR
jgi:hypothetical protein